MKNTHRIFALLVLALSASSTALAQEELLTHPELERAIVIEELEHDLQQALTIYEKLALDPQLSDELQRYASLRLGRLRGRLGNPDGARAAFADAAKGDDTIARLAKAELADPGRDEERARLLREEARNWIGKIRKHELIEDMPLSRYLGEDSILRNMLWIGPGAAPEIAREIETQMSEPSPDYHYVTDLAYVLWHVGGPDAAAYLDSIRARDNVELRRAILRGLTGASHFGTEFAARDLVSVAQAFLTDSDPDGITQTYALGHTPGRRDHRNWLLYDVEAVLVMTDSPIPAVRIAAFGLIAAEWKELRGKSSERSWVDPFTPRLARELDDVNPSVVQAAYGALANVGMLSASSRALLVQKLPSLRSDFHLNVNGGFTAPPDDPGIAMLLPMLRELGSSTDKTDRDRSVQRLIGAYLPSLKRDSLDLVLEYSKLGYDNSHQIPKWIAANCNAQDSARVLHAVAEEPALESLLNWAAEAELTPECWPALQMLSERFAENVTLEDSDYETLWLAIGRAATPEAISFLVDALGEEVTQERHYYLTNALLRASVVRPEADAKDALCRAFVVKTPGDDPDWKTARHRQLIFARLVELGDLRAFTLLPAAQELGLSSATLGSYGTPPPRASRYSRWTVENVSILVWHELWENQWTHFHGYSDADFATVWDMSFERAKNEPQAKIWRSLHSALGAESRSDLEMEADLHVKGLPIPDRYIGVQPKLVAVAARHWAMRAPKDSGDPSSEVHNGLALLLDIRRRRVLNDTAVNQALDELHSACLASSFWRIRKTALQLMPSEPKDAARRADLAALIDPNANVARVAMERIFDSQQPVSRELFQLVLQNPEYKIRTRAITTLAPYVEGGAAEIIKGLLKDPSTSVRVNACQFLATQVDSNPVPELLVALSDVELEVREAAASALRAIRFYHDEKAHWDRVFAGTELSTNGAAAALLKQANASNTIEVRLLAIRSLGALAAAETLPFLIEWTTDTNSEIQSAARAAIARIHSKSD